MIQVAALYRLSSKKQVARKRDDEVDIPGQKHAVERFMSHHPDWELVAQYEEKGVSAYKKTAEQREVLQQALADARTGKWKVLLCFKGDRLSRAGFGYLDVLDELESYGVQVWAVADNRLLTLEDEQLIVRAAEAYTANQESKKTSQRVSERMWQMAEDGRWVGGRIPFGYNLIQKVGHDGRVVVRGGRVVQELVPSDDVHIVVEMFEKYISGWGAVRIAEWMNTLRIPCFCADAWSKTTVLHVLSNSFYAGYIHYGRRSKRDQVPVLVKGTHLPLIGDDTWEQAQHVRSSRKWLKIRETDTSYVLSGVVKCALCGSRLAGRTQRFPRKDGTERIYRSYRCTRSQGTKTCPAKGIPAAKLEASFVDKIELAGRASDVRSFLLAFAEEDNRRYVADAAERKRATDEMATIEKALQKLDKTFFETDALSPAEYKAKKDDYLAQKRDMEAIVARPAVERPAIDVDKVVAVASRIRSLWYKHTRPEELRSFIASLVTEWNMKVLANQDGTVIIERA